MSDVFAAEAVKNCTPSASHIFSGCGYPAPSISDFYFTPLFKVGSVGFGKPGLLFLLSVGGGSWSLDALVWKEERSQTNAPAGNRTRT